MSRVRITASRNVNGSPNSPARRRTNSASVHNPDGLIMVLSFTTATQSALRGILGETLFDRKSDLLELPPLDHSDSVSFLRELVASWSSVPDDAPFPFSDKAVDAVVAELEERQGGGLTPRTLIKAFDTILREAELDIEDGDIEVIDPDYALKALPTDLG